MSTLNGVAAEVALRWMVDSSRLMAALTSRSRLDSSWLSLYSLRRRCWDLSLGVVLEDAIVRARVNNKLVGYYA